jgi:hypothetical protein
VLFISLLFLSTSCVKDVGTEQIYSSSFKIPLNIPFLKIDIEKEDFLNNNGQIINYHNTYLSDISGLFDKNKSDSLDYKINITKSINRTINCSFRYLDKDNIFLPFNDDFVISYDENTFTKKLTYEGVDYEDFIKIKWIQVNLHLGASGQIPNPPLTGNFHLQSSLGFIFDYQPKPKDN